MSTLRMNQNPLKSLERSQTSQKWTKTLLFKVTPIDWLNRLRKTRSKITSRSTLASTCKRKKTPFLGQRSNTCNKNSEGSKRNSLWSMNCRRQAGKNRPCAYLRARFGWPRVSCNTGTQRIIWVWFSPNFVKLASFLKATITLSFTFTKGSHKNLQISSNARPYTPISEQQKYGNLLEFYSVRTFKFIQKGRSSCLVAFGSLCHL